MGKDRDEAVKRLRAFFKRGGKPVIKKLLEQYDDPSEDMGLRVVIGHALAQSNDPDALLVGHPVVLDGTIDEIVQNGKELLDKGVDGLDLVTYRYNDVEHAAVLGRRCVEQLDIPIISAGSIGDTERMNETEACGFWGFTIGSAFFDKKFVPGGSFWDQLVFVINYMESIEA